MNPAIALRTSAPRNAALFIVVAVAFWLAAGIGLAPTLARSASSTGHESVCKCAHCPGGAACCCQGNGACPVGK